MKQLVEAITIDNAAAAEIVFIFLGLIWGIFVAHNCQVNSKGGWIVIYCVGFFCFALVGLNLYGQIQQQDGTGLAVFDIDFTGVVCIMALMVYVLIAGWTVIGRLMANKKD